MPAALPSDLAGEITGLLAQGVPATEVARRTGVSRGTVQRYKAGRVPAPRPEAVTHWRPPDASAYSYLLGMYLGDGHLCGPRRNTLRITLNVREAAIRRDCALAIARTLDVRVLHRLVPVRGVAYLDATSPLWHFAFPQHGAGKKHERSIVLEAWQREIVDLRPREFLRALIHSDGCRTVNRFTVDLPRGGRREYAYVRYFFSNESADIRGLFCEYCERLGIRWTQSSQRNVSVADRASVELLEEFVGPKA
jgi:Helix-turn-helix domain of resolvase